jgi:hypothetical protein
MWLSMWGSAALAQEATPPAEGSEAADEAAEAAPEEAEATKATKATKAEPAEEGEAKATKAVPAETEADDDDASEADDEPKAVKVEPEAEPVAKPQMSSAPMMLPPPPPPEDELPIPTLQIDRIPPSTSYEFAVQVSYGQVSYFRDSVPPWVGFGLRGAVGKNFGLHRIGGQLGFTSEGDMGIHTLLVLEPAIAYDVVTPFGLQLGVSGGPALMYWSDNSTLINERDIGFAPSVAARVGWSQTWTRVGRRLFVFAEPKLRYANGSPDVLVAIAVGSGAGR